MFVWSTVQHPRRFCFKTQKKQIDCQSSFWFIFCRSNRCSSSSWNNSILPWKNKSFIMLTFTLESCMMLTWTIEKSDYLYPCIHDHNSIHLCSFACRCIFDSSTFHTFLYWRLHLNIYLFFWLSNMSWWRTCALGEEQSQYPAF